MKKMMVYMRSGMVVWCFCVMPWSMVWSMGECEQKANHRPIDEYGGLGMSLSENSFYSEEGHDHALQCKIRTQGRIIFLSGRLKEAKLLPTINSPLPTYCEALSEALATEKKMLRHWEDRCALLGIEAAPSTDSNAGALVGSSLEEELKAGSMSLVVPFAEDDGKELGAESDSHLRRGSISRVVRRMARQFFVG